MWLLCLSCGLLLAVWETGLLVGGNSLGHVNDAAATDYLQALAGQCGRTISGRQCVCSRLMYECLSIRRREGDQGALTMYSAVILKVLVI